MTRCLAYLQSVQPGEYTNCELAQWFGVTERTIRVDHRKFREEMADAVREDDVALVVGDITFAFKRLVRDVEGSKAKCRRGTSVYLDHCKTAFDMELKKLKALQDLGFLPKNLGNMTKEEFLYAAVVMPQTGAASSRPVSTFDAATQQRLAQERSAYLQEGVVEAE